MRRLSISLFVGIIGILLLICISLQPAEAKAASLDDLTYEIHDGKVTITGCKENARDKLVIPSMIEGYPVTRIGERAFEACWLLTEITIPNSVTSIGPAAFVDCNYLTSITIPASVTTIGGTNTYTGYVFRGCFSLTGIWVDANNAYYSSDSHGVLFNKNKTQLLAAPGAISEVYTVPVSVTCIDGYSFNYCCELPGIRIPSSVTSIGDFAFEYCTSLTEVTVPDSLTSIGTGAFANSNNLSWNIYGNAKYLGNKNNPYVALVKKASADITQCVVAPNTKFICASAFSDCGQLASISIPNSVISIGDWAFNNCPRLTGLVLPNSITYIGLSAFSYCSSLTDITIPDGVTKIVYDSFGNCTGLTSLIIGNGVTCIENSAFNGCSSLGCVTIGTGVTNIDSNAFRNCSSLNHVLYKGTQKQWSNISIVRDNEDLISATTHYNCTGNEITNGQCAVCLEEHAHNWGHGVIIKPVTCLEDGLTRYTCSICGETREEINAALGFHVWNSREIIKAATCKENGIETFVCFACGETKTEATPKLSDHSWDYGEITKAPTCKEYGVKTYTCTVCGEILTRNIEKSTEHTPGSESTATGDQICTVCGEVLQSATGETEPTVAPTTRPTVAPTTKPTVSPTTSPTGTPTTEPTVPPPTTPTGTPTVKPTEPTVAPTVAVPTTGPAGAATQPNEPSTRPGNIPTAEHTPPTAELEKENSEQGPSFGAAFIVIGIVVAAAGIGGALFIILKKKR